MGTNFYLRGYINNDDPKVHIGVRQFSVFVWAMDINYLKRQVADKNKPISCPCCHQKYTDPEKVIEDEHENLYTFEEFCENVNECYIRDKTLINTWFC